MFLLIVTYSNFTGASINAVTKSGTNELKGTVYTYQKPKNFIGKSINDVDVPNVESYKSSLYGFTLGAPIIKNKLFFFVNNILITKQPFRICPRRLFYFLRRDPS